jgi:parvulin-like peptidyl-prolyl isomerase
MVIGVLAAGWLMGCSLSSGLITTATPSAIPSTSTPTLEPPAALVNGEPIRLVDFEQEIVRFEAAQFASGTDLATLGDYKTQVLQALIDRLLLAQGARTIGIEVDETSLENAVEKLTFDLGGNEALSAWLAEMGYTLENLKTDLVEEMLAAQMVEQIVVEVVDTTEQVHARHILVSTMEDAAWLRGKVINGVDFAEMARQYSLDPSTRLAGGDLGWFPPRYLLIPEVEEAAFNLQPGEVSEVIESRLGFHIVQTIDRGIQPLSPDALRRLREQTITEWLASQRETAEIQIIIAP